MTKKIVENGVKPQSNLMKQTTFENIVANGKIAHNEQFLHLPQCFRLYLIITPLFIENFQIFARMLSKLSAADLLYVVKGSSFPSDRTLVTDTHSFPSDHHLSKSLHFLTYNKSVADNFENVYLKTWKIFIIVGIYNY